MRGVSPHSSSLSWAAAGFALSLFIPSTATVQRYQGLVGVAGYLLIASVVLLLLVKGRHTLARIASRVSERQVLWLAALTFLVLLVAVAVIYPVANSGIIGGGSDGDDALNTATRELLHGRYPYYPRTYLGNPTSQLPGAMLLAIPFVLLGSSAYQNVFWLLLFLLAMKVHFRDGRVALLLLWAVFALSPVVLYDIMIGSDHIANSLYVCLAVLWMAWAVGQPSPGGWKMLLAALFLGIALSSRVNFLVLLPLVFAALVKSAGWKTGLRYSAITMFTFLVVTVPFYLYDPHGFAPLHTAGKLGQFESVARFAGLGIPLATVIVALVLAYLQPAGCKPGRLLRDCALVLAFPVLCGIILFSIRSGKVNFTFAAFGVFFLFFGAASSWQDLFAGTALEVT